MNANNNSFFSSKIQDLAKEMQKKEEDFFNLANQEASADSYPVMPAISTEGVTASSGNEQIDLRGNEQWLDDDNETYDGQLALDVYQDKKNIYIKAAIAGVLPSDIEINLNNDMITVKGKRKQCIENIEEEDYYIRECYWGGFSRSIILPVDIKSDQVKAEIQNGLLTITLPKSKRPRNTRIEVKEKK
ncbi:MAG: Hsp20/alpha crystallin family protein [Patescibacteria group bacterium]